jgi:hypothetical protein
MRTSLRPLFWSAAVATALVLPAAASAQQPLGAVTVSARSARADDLDARAAELQAGNSRWQWRRSAELREQAAGLRSPSDPRAFESLHSAALVRHVLGDRGRAIALMERAADQALARGDVFSAASSFSTLAYMSAEARDAQRSAASSPGAACSSPSRRSSARSSARRCRRSSRRARRRPRAPPSPWCRPLP